MDVLKEVVKSGGGREAPTEDRVKQKQEIAVETFEGNIWTTVKAAYSSSLEGFREKKTESSHCNMRLESFFHVISFQWSLLYGY